MTSRMNAGPIHTILLATDFTNTSTMAEQYAAVLAKKFCAKLVVAHVILPSTYQFIAAEGIALQADASNQWAKDQMSQVAARLSSIAHECIICRGFISEEIYRIVAQQHIDLVVLGSKPHSTARRFLFGSLTEEVLRRVSCPTIVVPFDARPPAARIRSVVLALDLSDAGRSASRP